MTQFSTYQKLVCLFMVFGMAPILISCSEKKEEPTVKINKVWLIGDSTMANYALEENYQSNRHPVTGWGQVFQPFMAKDSLFQINHLVQADSLIVDDRAKGGRSTRTFFQEGRWRAVYNEMQPGDLVLIQFGHNDAAVGKTERYVNVEGYQEFLRLFIQQTREKGGTPILLTPVARNYPWENGHLQNVHGDYPDAMKAVAFELGVLLIDLNERSMDHFSDKGKEYVSANYFMNLPAGVYEAYPDGQDDNTHFQPEGAKAVARLVFEELKTIEKE
jgi:lysophospholipase L1-like esterase